MNIIIAVDKNYIEHAKTMLYSLACNNEEHLDVYLLQKSIPQKDLKEFSKFVEIKSHGTLHVVEIPQEAFKNVPMNDRMSLETYYRLLSFSLLPDSVDRALWLDADIIVKGNIAEFYHQDFEGNLAVCCAEKAQVHNERLGLPLTHRYFNAGVILFCISEMRKTFKEDDVFNCVEHHKEHLLLMDQDVLNVLLSGRVKYCDTDVYNNGAFGFSILDKEKMKEIENTARIIHFWGAMKPWNWRGANWADRYWWEYEWKRGRIGETLSYRVLNTPVKGYLLLRELYYMICAQLKRIK